MQRVLFMALFLVAIGLFWLINGPLAQRTTGNEQAASLPDGFDQLLLSRELSAVLVFEGKVFAGGVSGLFRIDPATLSVEEILFEGRPFQSVRAIQSVEPKQGGPAELWVGSEEGLTVIQSGEAMRTLGKAEGLRDPRVQAIVQVDENTVFAATYSGIAVISPDGIRWLTKKDGLPGESIKVLFMDSEGFVWAGSYDNRGGGVAVLTGEGLALQQLTIADGLVHNSITAIAEGQNGQILVGGGVFTEGGASVLEKRGGSWLVTQTIRLADGLAGDKVRHIYVDGANRIWFCSEYDGVAIWEGGVRQRLFTVADGLSDNEVKQITQDDTGDYWLATRSGLTRIRSRVLESTKILSHSPAAD